LAQPYFSRGQGGVAANLATTNVCGMWQESSALFCSVRLGSFILSPADAVATTSEQCLCAEDAGS